MAWRRAAAGVAFVGIAALGFAAAALSSRARNDPPVKSMTITDAAGDSENAADIRAVTVKDWSDSTLGFTISVAGRASIYRGDEIGIFVDDDQDRSTGVNGWDYLLAMYTDPFGLPVVALYNWSTVATDWERISRSSLAGEFDTGGQLVFTVPKADVQVSDAFNFAAQTGSFVGFTMGEPGSTNVDDAPDAPGFVTYRLGSVTTATTTTTATTITTTTNPTADASLTGLRWRRVSGRRELIVSLHAGETVAAEIRLLRGATLLARKDVAGLRPGAHRVVVPIGAAVAAGSARLSLRLTNGNGDHKTIVREIDLPRK